MQMHMLSLFLWFSRCTIRNREPYIWRYSILRLSFIWNFLAVLLYLNLEREVPKVTKSVTVELKYLTYAIEFFVTLIVLMHTLYAYNAIKVKMWFGIEFIKNTLKVQSCKLYDDKYMIAPTKLKCASIYVLVLKLFSRKVFFTNRKRQQKLLKSRLIFKKIANFTGQLLQNYR